MASHGLCREGMRLSIYRDPLPADLLASAVIALSVLGLSTLALTVASLQPAISSAVLPATAIAILVQGHLGAAALFPRRGDLSTGERAACIMIMGFIPSAFLGLLLWLSPWGLSAGHLAPAISILSLASVIPAWIRRSALPRSMRLDLSLRRARSSRSLRGVGFMGRGLQNRSAGRTLAAVLALLGVIALMALACTFIVPDGSSGEVAGTEFSVLGPGGEPYRVDSPMDVEEPSTALVRIWNREGETTMYTLRLAIDGRVAFSRDIRLGRNQTWEHPVCIIPADPGRGQAVQFLLYREGDLENPCGEHSVSIDVLEAPVEEKNASSPADEADPADNVSPEIINDPGHAKSDGSDGASATEEERRQSPEEAGIDEVQKSSSGGSGSGKSSSIESASSRPASSKSASGGSSSSGSTSGGSTSSGSASSGSEGAIVVVLDDEPLEEMREDDVQDIDVEENTLPDPLSEPGAPEEPPAKDVQTIEEPPAVDDQVLEEPPAGDVQTIEEPEALDDQVTDETAVDPAAEPAGETSERAEALSINSFLPVGLDESLGEVVRVSVEVGDAPEDDGSQGTGQENIEPAGPSPASTAVQGSEVDAGSSTGAATGVGSGAASGSDREAGGEGESIPSEIPGSEGSTGSFGASGQDSGGSSQEAGGSPVSRETGGIEGGKSAETSPETENPGSQSTAGQDDGSSQQTGISSGSSTGDQSPGAQETSYASPRTEDPGKVEGSKASKDTSGTSDEDDSSIDNEIDSLMGTRGFHPRDSDKSVKSDNIKIVKVDDKKDVAVLGRKGPAENPAEGSGSKYTDVTSIKTDG